MSFGPVLPFGGLAGWSFLERTRENQQKLFNDSLPVLRDTEYFRQEIGSVRQASDLVSDRRLLSVALGAFGLDDDVGNKYFIERILDDGTLKPDSLANRLSDKRYLALSKAFGFGDFDVPNTQLSDFAEEIVTAFQDRQFDRKIGDQNADMRLALGVERDLARILEKDTSENGYWYSIMGTPPLRRVFETALGLPGSLARLGVDRQLDIFRQKAESVFGAGGVSQFKDAEKQEKLVRLFLVRSQTAVDAGGFSPGAAALTLLQNVRLGSPLL